MFSCRSLILSSLTFRFLIHFELIYVCDIKERSNLFIYFTCSCPVFLAPCVEETVFPT